MLPNTTQFDRAVRATGHSSRPCCNQHRTCVSRRNRSSHQLGLSAGRHLPVPRVQAVSQAAGAAEHVPVAVSGAGIAGLATAVALHKLGVPVVVLERAPGLRQEGSAVSLWSNAWRGLDALGVGQQLRSNYQLLKRVELVKSSGQLLRSFTFEECTTSAAAGGVANETRGVLRAHLLQALADQLPAGVVQFDSGVMAISTAAQGKPLLQLSSGQTVSCDVLIGADGANSVVAEHLGLPRPNFAGYVAYRGLAKFPGELPVPLDTIRQMFGAGVRAGMYPLTQNEAYWFICFNADEGARPADAAGYVSEALAAVEGWSWGIQEAVRYTQPTTISRGTIRDRWTAGSFGRGSITLAGDAAHPMTPNLGQGGCTAIEDGVVLARQLAPLIAGSGSSSSSRGLDAAAVAAVLRSYEAERSQRCLPLTVRSYAFGAALQLPFPPVVAARDLFLENVFRPAHFLDHTAYDCGTLQG